MRTSVAELRIFHMIEQPVDIFSNPGEVGPIPWPAGETAGTPGTAVLVTGQSYQSILIPSFSQQRSAWVSLYWTLVRIPLDYRGELRWIITSVLTLQVPVLSQSLTTSRNPLYSDLADTITLASCSLVLSPWYYSLDLQSHHCIPTSGIPVSSYGCFPGSHFPLLFLFWNTRPPVLPQPEQVINTTGYILEYRWFTVILSYSV